MCIWVPPPSWRRKEASTALRRSRCSWAIATTLHRALRLTMLIGQHRLPAPSNTGEDPIMSTDSVSKAVLITGCSSGIGHATAEHLAGRGWKVYATARRPESISDLEAAGCKTLALDVNDESSMTEAVRQVEAAEGAVAVLVNNAGYSQSGPVEEIPLNDVRRQFETNVFGLVRMCQLVLPGMRRQGWGRIVNVSSMGGRLTFPAGGFYHATKHAVEAISDALRFEVAGFGVGVAIIEPGLILTGFGDVAADTVTGAGADDSPYAAFNAAVAQTTKQTYEGGPLVRLGGGPETVARAIERAISARRPRTRYKVTPSARLALGARRLLPDRVWDMAMRSLFPQPRG